MRFCSSAPQVHPSSLKIPPNLGHASLSGGRVLLIGSDLSGSGTITISEPENTGGSTATMFLGNGSAFSGDWIIEDTVAAVGKNALGTGNITITETGALDFDTDFHSTTTKITMLKPTSRLIVDQVISIPEMEVQGLPIFDDTYEGEKLDALGDNFVNAGGKLIIAGPNPDSDGDGLLDSWELLHFGDLAQTGDGDFDGDGSRNAQEELAATDPTDAASVFSLFISEVVGGGNSPALQFSWPSSTQRSYFLQVSLDLKTWLTLSLIPGEEGTTTFIDSANFPPGSGDEPLFYRVAISGS